MPDPHEDIDELIAALRDGQGEGGERLAEALRDDPRARERYLRQAYLGALLRESFGELEAVKPKPRTRRWVAPLVGVAAAIAIACLAFWPKGSEALVATLELGSVGVSIDGVAVAEGARIAPGQHFTLTGENGSAAFVYPDGTRFLATGGARVSLVESDRKHLVVGRGVLHADVSKQPLGKPMEIHTPTARLEILGTRFVVGALEGATDLNVTEGKVRMTRTDSGETVDVGAGRRGRFEGLRGLAVSELPDVPGAWELDFEDGEKSWRYGAGSDEGLPSGSFYGVRATDYILPFNGETYYHIEFNDPVDGLVGLTEDSHFHLTYQTTADETWFNVFIYAVYADKNGQTQFQQYKLDGRNLLRYRDLEHEWHSVTVPASAFKAKLSEQGDYGETPPPPGAIVTRVRVGNPSPDRELQIDAIGFTPDGPGQKVLTTLEK